MPVRGLVLIAGVLRLLEASYLSDTDECRDHRGERGSGMPLPPRRADQ